MTIGKTCAISQPARYHRQSARYHRQSARYHRRKTVPKGLMLVQSVPSDPDREDEYNAWYTGKHLPEVLEIGGIVSARRYKLVGRKGQAPAYLAVYELEADDVRAPLREMGARVASGEIAMSDVIQQDPAPTITLYELTD
jgi:hypothetical protein